jgi:hypothetical protein
LVTVNGVCTICAAFAAVSGGTRLPTRKSRSAWRVGSRSSGASQDSTSTSSKRASIGPGGEHRRRAVDAAPRAVRQVPRELALAAANVEHGRQALCEQPLGDASVDVGRERMAVHDRAGGAKAFGPVVVVRRDRPHFTP